MRAVLEPVVTSVVLLRDKVEQDRFVVRWVGRCICSCSPLRGGREGARVKGAAGSPGA